MENDHGVLTFNGTSIAVEFADEPGLLTVGTSGTITFDLLADSGGYQGELAIVSLTGMESLERGSAEFIEEAARRALSGVDGFVVFRDATEGARFSGELGEANRNRGDYSGTQTLSFEPGDEVFFMLVPNGTVAEVLANPTLTGDKRPLFSLADANPDGADQFGQFAVNGGNGLIFGFEDLAGNSDKDFNDLLFRVDGVEGSATALQDLMATDRDWTGTPFGQQIRTFILENSEFAPPQPLADVLDTPAGEVLPNTANPGSPPSNSSAPLTTPEPLDGTETDDSLPNNNQPTTTDPLLQDGEDNLPIETVEDPIVDVIGNPNGDGTLGSNPDPDDSAEGTGLEPFSLGWYGGYSRDFPDGRRLRQYVGNLRCHG